MRLLREKRPVRREGDIERAERDEALDEHLEIAAEQRLPAGEPDLLHPVGHEGAGQQLDLLEREQLLAVHESVSASEDLLRHAVDAAEVAPVGDRDPEVADRTAGHVECGRRRRHVAVQRTPSPMGRRFAGPRRARE